MQFVELPSNLQAAVIGLVVALFALVVDFIIGVLPASFKWVGDFLKKYQQEWALAAGAALLELLQNVLPTGFEDVSIKGVAFVLALIAVFSPYLLARRALAKAGVKAFWGKPHS